MKLPTVLYGYKRRLLTQTKSSTLSASEEENISDH